MASMKNPVTGHEIKTDDESAAFWSAAGYRAVVAKAPAKKATPAKKSSK